MAEEILRLQPDKVKVLIKQGKIEVVSSPKVEPIASMGGSFEKAKQLFGEDFLGEEAIRVMEEKCKAAGIDVKFVIPALGNFDTIGLNAGVSNQLLETAKADEQRGRSRLVVLRPELMVVNRESKPITILNLRELFKNKNPFGQGKLFYNQTWFDNENFAKEGLKASIGLPAKEVLPDSLSKKWEEQETLLEPGEHRREAIETLWDTLLYYSATGKKVLERHWDWGNTRTSDGYLVMVGGFRADGVDVSSRWPGRSGPGVGVCPSR